MSVKIKHMKDDLKDELFEPIKLFGKLVLFTPVRIKDEDLPKGIYKYEVRHDDEGQGIMCELSTRILVNHWGTILSNKPIQLDYDGYRYIDEEKDVQFLDMKSLTISRYLTKERNKSQER